MSATGPLRLRFPHRTYGVRGAGDAAHAQVRIGCSTADPAVTPVLEEIKLFLGVDEAVLLDAEPEAPEPGETGADGAFCMDPKLPDDHRLHGMFVTFRSVLLNENGSSAKSNLEMIQIQ